MLIYIRHGQTKPEEANHVGGWTSDPLTPKGRATAEIAGRSLAKLGLHPDTFDYKTSDLLRAHQTAQIIGKHIGKAPIDDPTLRTWNTGALAGKPRDQVKQQLQALVAHPDQPAPGGQSINRYRARIEPMLRSLVESPHMHVRVGHSRGAAILEGIASPVGGRGKDVDAKFLTERSDLKPGGIMLLGRDWKPKIQNPESTS